MQALIRALWNIRFRGKVRILSPLVPRHGIKMSNIFGARVELDLADYVQRMMYLGCFEREETQWAMRYLRPGTTFVDAGANAGYFTFLAASRVGTEGCVLAIEPDPVLFAKLEASIRRNALTNVLPFHCGLGRNSGKLDLYVPPANHANRAPTMVHVPEWDKTSVLIRPLDEVLKETGRESVDLLKLDVEGFEAEVLAGAQEALRSRRIKAILCEFNDYWLQAQGTSSEQLYESIRSFGFRAKGARPQFTPNSVFNEFFTLA